MKDNVTNMSKHVVWQICTHRDLKVKENIFYHRYLRGLSVCVGPLLTAGNNVTFPSWRRFCQHVSMELLEIHRSHRRIQNHRALVHRDFAGRADGVGGRATDGGLVVWRVIVRAELEETDRSFSGETKHQRSKTPSRNHNPDLTGIPKALRMFILHMGHVRCSCSHGSTQCLWKTCLSIRHTKKRLTGCLARGRGRSSDPHLHGNILTTSLGR